MRELSYLQHSTLQLRVKQMANTTEQLANLVAPVTLL